METAFCPFELETSWKQVLGEAFNEPYLLELAAFLEKERRLGAVVYPPKEMIFNAFYYTPYEKVKVVIMGQDPYHGPNQAHGLSFSVAKGVPPPPSLKNIYKELKEDLGIHPPEHGCLIPWAKQGVLLLNAVLTVRKGEAFSHNNKGWEAFTDTAIAALNARKDPIIFVLWGKAAREKCCHVAAPHQIITSAHPSPLSAHNGFFGSRPFSKVNQILKNWGKEPINWSPSS